MSVGVVFLQPVRSSLAGVVVPSSSAQFCSSVSLDRCACRPVDQLVVLVPERLPGPAVIVGQLHVEGLAPALQRVAVILGVLPEPADQVASTIASIGLFIATQAYRHAASRSRLNARDKYR